MKQLAQYQDGRLEWQEVPVPAPPPGGVLVELTHSVISPGTERHKVEVARMSLLAKARARPDQVRKVLQTAKQLGWQAAWKKVRNRLESPSPLGYSAAGMVVAVDPAQQEFAVGDLVACGGAECAHHAEFVAVPGMLAAKIPAGVGGREAAFATMAAIAMHGVRQADVKLGEVVAVVGQGLVGLLVTAMARLAGSTVAAVDPQPERRTAALGMGASVAVDPSEAVARARLSSRGLGVDHVILCVGGASREVTRQAVDMVRDRGRITIVGMLDASWEWKAAYAKEVEIRYARSYGPGRYDPDYEWGGHDYPAGYVRWTEKRHLESCLALMASGGLAVDPLISREVDFSEAVSCYEALVSGTADIGIVLCYGPANRPASHPLVEVPSALPVPRHAPLGAKPGVDVIGAGNFARTMLLPFFRDKVTPGLIVTRTPLSAGHAQRKFGFREAATDAAGCWGPVGSPATLIATRHDTHAPLVLQALAAGRSVFVEKPLCLTRKELGEIRHAAAQAKGSLMVGFNRRFAPAFSRLRGWVDLCPGPVSLQVTVNAGPLAPDHWYANHGESGGRLIGEGCHFVDLALALARTPPVSVVAFSLAGPGERRDDAFHLQIRFADGSSAQIAYQTRGEPGAPKETITLAAEGVVAVCRDFLAVESWTNKGHRVEKFHSKGHREEMTAWVTHLEKGGEPPLPVAGLFLSMEMVFAAAASLQSGGVVEIVGGEA